MAVYVLLVLLLAMAGHSAANYCVCKDGPEATLQKTLDYACGAGADCTPITQGGVCFQPNTVKAHCSYAVNSYFQKKGPNSQQNCDFSGTAGITSTDPSPGGTCTFPSTGSSTGGGTPTTPGTSTPTTPIGGNTGGNTTPSTTPTTGGTTTLTPTTPLGSSGGLGGGGLGPTGSGITDSSAAAVFTIEKQNLFVVYVTLWFSGLVFWLG